MNRFLVLSKRIINTRYIKDILVEKNEYVITLACEKRFSGFMLFGSGFISDESFDEIYIRQDKKNTNTDFDTVSDFDKVSEFIKSIS